MLLFQSQKEVCDFIWILYTLILHCISEDFDYGVEKLKCTEGEWYWIEFAITEKLLSLGYYIRLFDIPIYVIYYPWENNIDGPRTVLSQGLRIIPLNSDCNQSFFVVLVLSGSGQGFDNEGNKSMVVARAIIGIEQVSRQCVELHLTIYFCETENTRDLNE